MTATRRPLEPSFQALIDGTFPGCEPGSEQRVVRVVIAEVRGSAPREPGAAMLVSGDAQFGTIGGGRLEFEAVRLARLMLAEQPRGDWQRRMESWPLGPNLGQCCGGHVGVLFEIFGARERDGLRSLHNGDAITRPVASGAPLAAARSHPRAALDGASFIEPLGAALTPVFIYGAGHTGRAIVKALEPLDFVVTWIDTAADRFPGALSEPASGRLTKVVAANPAR
ncbi:MAG: XdhC family protein, partial [Pseudomonadota bacterium]